MLNCLDHIVLLSSNFETAVSNYVALLGFEPETVSKGENFQTALFRTGNTGLEIMSPISKTARTRTAEILGDAGSALTSLAFAAKDISEARRILQRRGGDPGKNSETGTFRLSDDICAGIKTFVIPPGDRSPKNPNSLSLDHLVINTPNPDRATAHYGARLGIRFALDRTNADWGARFLFFKLGDIVLEVIHRTGKEHDPTAPDKIWGLTWKVDDLKAHHKRLSDSGVTVSEIRAGRKPGTHVFTAKSHSDGIPTLFLSQLTLHET